MAARVECSGLGSGECQPQAARPDLLYCSAQGLGCRKVGRKLGVRRPNKSFKPKPLRYAKHMAGKACHVFRFTARLGLTLVLGGTGSSCDCCQFASSSAQRSLGASLSARPMDSSTSSAPRRLIQTALYQSVQLVLAALRLGALSLVASARASLSAHHAKVILLLCSVAA